MFFDAPSPPSWLTEAATTFLMHIAEPMYWLLIIVSFLAYLILRWQKRPRESHAAQALRWFTLSKAFLWMAFALGRVFGEWRIVMFAAAAIYVGLTGIWWLVALWLTYVRPTRAAHVALVSDVLPPYAATNRRDESRRSEREIDLV
jgi:amino acid transporter